MPIPQAVYELRQKTRKLALMIDVPVATTVMSDGLYVATRRRRDPINSNRMRSHFTVRLRRDGVEVFRSEERVSTFPTEFLITQLMLVR